MINICTLSAPMTPQMAIAAYRYDSSGDDGDDRGVSQGTRGDGEGQIALLPPAGGGPSDVELAALDARAPVAGLYVRLERLIARQVALDNADDDAWGTAAGRRRQWLRLRGLLSRAALRGCATPGNDTAGKKKGAGRERG